MIESTERPDLAWMLQNLLRVPGVVHALVLSADGLPMQPSLSLAQDQADLLAAGASSLHSVAAGIGRQFTSGPVRQAVIEYDEHTLFVADAGPNARLAVVCEQIVDMGTVAFEMSRLVASMGENLGTDMRTAPSRAVGGTGTGHD
ncbi:roadblock/LC7 domain-containing protein [Plantactinospora sp. WMMB782]|uniref:roadblock/LC7 domain-containing protein n=1 Tax=Plantactinospora sp. WMMB782 TaxID=3404121 RepID=UPI003B9346F8